MSTKRSLGAVLGLVLALPGASVADGWPTLQPLARSVSEAIGTCNERLEETSNEVDIRAKRLARFLSSGEAMYHKLADNVLLDPALLVGGKLRTLPAWTALGNETEAYRLISVVYHELAHAEMDHFVENKSTPEDAAFYDLLVDTVTPWFENNVPEASKALVAEEWFGNYRAFVISAVLNDLHAVLLANGIYPRKGAIEPAYLKMSLRNGLRPNEFHRFSTRVLKPHLRKLLNTPYKDRVKRGTFGVKKTFGTHTVDTSTFSVANGFQAAWWDSIWDHYDHFHCLPDTMAELVAHMNATRTTELAQLRAARLKAWRAQGAGAAGATGSVGASGSGEDLLGQDDEDDGAGPSLPTPRD